MFIYQFIYIVGLLCVKYCFNFVGGLKEIIFVFVDFKNLVGVIK